MKKIKEIFLKKFKVMLADSAVFVNVPKINRGPIKGNDIKRILLDLKNNVYQIGTSVGIETE